MPEAMIAKGKAELDATYKKTGPGLSVEERARIIADLDTECLEIERREEALIRAAEDRGEVIWRRPRASMIAVLESRQRLERKSVRQGAVIHGAHRQRLEPSEGPRGAAAGFYLTAAVRCCTVLSETGMVNLILRKGAEEARNQLPDLLEAAEKGRSTIITRHGRPVAALVPIEAYGAAIRQQPLTPVAGSGRGLWGQNSTRTLRKLRDEWSR